MDVLGSFSFHIRLGFGLPGSLGAAPRCGEFTRLCLRVAAQFPPLAYLGRDTSYSDPQCSPIPVFALQA